MFEILNYIDGGGGQTTVETQNGVEEILSHKWFASIDMDKLLKKELPSPYIPKLSADFAYFDPKLTALQEVPDTILPTEKIAMVNKGKHNFEGFGS